MMDSCQDAVTYVSEYLHRIGSITLVIQLADGYEGVLIRFPSTASKSLDFIFRLKTNKLEILSRQIKLPVEFNPQFAGTERHLGMGGSQSVQLSIKTAPVAKQEPDQLSFLNHNQESTPWSSNYLTPFANTGSQFSCVQCRNDVLTCKSINTWKPLPSETWAEMMDFWHCHKPAEPEGTTEAFNPSYTVSSFHAYPLTAFVGTSHILFHPSHFVSPEVYISIDDIRGAKYPLVLCSNCNSWLGYKEFSDTFKIYKWALYLSSEVQTPSQCPGYLYVSSIIDELIRSHGIYTFSLFSEEFSREKGELQISKSEEVLIWIFNPDFKYCTNTTSGEVDRGLKVFYSTDSARIPELKEVRGDVEQLYFPLRLINDLLQHLIKNTKLYPVESQKIGKDWKVSILDRL